MKKTTSTKRRRNTKKKKKKKKKKKIAKKKKKTDMKEDEERESLRLRRRPARWRLSQALGGSASKTQRASGVAPARGRVALGAGEAPVGLAVRTCELL